jgi:hypothetical protein
MSSKPISDLRLRDQLALPVADIRSRSDMAPVTSMSKRAGLHHLAVALPISAEHQVAVKATAETF